MDALICFGFFAVIITIGIVATVLSSRYERKRTLSWQADALRPGMQFLGENNDVLSRFRSLKLFQNGRNHRVFNALAVDSGKIRIVVADYRYVTGSGKSSKTHNLTICALESALLDVPHCSLRPEVKLLDAIGSLFGGQDIDFQEDPAFSAAFVLQGPDEAAIRQAFTAPIRSWFAEQAGRKFFFEAQGNKLVFHLGKRTPPAEAPELMDQALQILNLLAGPQA